MRYHASKKTAYRTTKGHAPHLQRRGRPYFEFEQMVEDGLLRRNWDRKAILMEEYLDAREG